MITLTPRQLEILRLHAEGHTSRDIRKALFIAENTVKTHNAAIRRKLGAHTMPQAVAVAYERGILVSRQLDSARAWAVELEQELAAQTKLREVIASEVRLLAAERAALSTLLRGMARRSSENRRKWQERAARVREVIRERNEATRIGRYAQPVRDLHEIPGAS